MNYITWEKNYMHMKFLLTKQRPKFQEATETDLILQHGEHSQ